MPQLLQRCLLVMTTVVVLPTTAIADTPPAPMGQVKAQAGASRAFSIPPQALSNAINSFSCQSGWQVSLRAELAANKQSSAVDGDYSADQALSRLLLGTGLQWRKTAENSVLIYALETPAASASAITLGAVRVQGAVSAGDEVYKTAGSANVITRDQIERFRGTSVGDIFQGTTGVLVGENRNSGGLDVNIRGMQGQGRVPVLIDGSRQETTVYRGYSGVSSRSYIDPDLIGKIRIDKGPSMTAEGTGATGGVVNVNTLSAADIVKPGQDGGVRVRGSLTGNNSAAPEPGTFAGYYVPYTKYRSKCDRSIDCTPQYTVPDSFAPEQGMNRPGLLDLRGTAGSLAAARFFEWGELVAAYTTRDQGNYYAGEDGPTPYIVQGEPIRSFWYTETTYSREGVSPFRAEERIPNTQFQSESWLLKGSVILPQEQSLELGYIGYSSDFGEMMPSQIRSFGQARQWLDSKVTNDTYTARYRWEPLDYNWADLRINLWHTDTVTDMNTPAVGSVDIEDNTPRRDDYQRTGVDVTNKSRFDAIGHWEVEYGIAAQWEQHWR